MTIDLLVILDGDVDTSTEEELFDIGFEIELKYDVIFGVIAYSKRFWNSLGRVMPLYKNIKKEGINV